MNVHRTLMHAVTPVITLLGNIHVLVLQAKSLRQTPSHAKVSKIGKRKKFRTACFSMQLFCYKKCSFL